MSCIYLGDMFGFDLDFCLYVVGILWYMFGMLLLYFWCIFGALDNRALGQAHFKQAFAPR